MPDPRPHLIVSEEIEKLPILIVDRTGIIAEELAAKLKDQFSLVILTARRIPEHENITHIHYDKKIPQIPDQNYSEIMVIYQGERTTLDMLPPIAEKAQQIDAGLSFITSLYYYDKNLKKYLSHSKYHKIRQIIYGEVFGEEDLDQNSLTSYINQVRQSKKIEIPGNGLHKTYPVGFADLIDAIVTILFTGSLKSGIIYVLPKHGFTQLSIARAFQKNEPEIKINFIKQSHKQTEYDIPADARYFFQSYDLAQKLKVLPRPKQPQTSQSNNKATPKKNKKANHRGLNTQKRYIWLLYLLLLFLVPIIIEYVCLLSGSLLLLQSLKTAEQNDIAAAQKYNFLAGTTFFTSLLIGENMSFINPVLYLQRDPITQKAQIGKSLVEIEGDVLDSSQIIKNIYANKSTDPKNDFLHATSKIKNSLVSWQKLKAEGDLPAQVLDKMNSLQEPLALLGDTIDTFPDLLGFTQKKKYLILFQNNMELRPGGGFIGSFATVQIENGKAGKLEIHDVYDADGKLSTHIEPPFPLRRYLGASHFFLRDSNFDVDFIANARSARKFLQLETGEEVDGVVAIDTDFVKNLIAVFGPLDIPDFNEKVTADNFYLLTETHAEKDFFPGSTQKKDFLRAVYNALESKITQDPKIPYAMLVQKITESIRKKHLLIALPDTPTQKIFTVNRLSSSLQENRVKGENEFLDFLGINEANLGMNKSNFYLKRSIEQKVVLDEKGSATEAVSLVYENTSTKGSVFGGDYKNYLRFILPASSALDTVQINDNLIPTTNAITNVADYTRPGFAPPQQLEVEKTAYEGRMIYGFMNIIPIHSSERITISYTLPGVYDPSRNVFSYDLYRFKQPGTDDDPYTFSISYPVSFHVIEGAEKFTDVGGKLLYSDILSQDKEINLTFSKK